MTKIEKELLIRAMGLEGVDSDHPSDPGGRTRFGVTKQTAEEYGHDVTELTYDEAMCIMADKHMYKPGIHRVIAESDLVGYRMLDISINCGSYQPCLWLQEELNNLNRKEELYGDIAEDGIIGDGTISALKSFLEERKQYGDAVLEEVLESRQCTYYSILARGREKFEDFYYGWVLQRIVSNHR